MAIIIKIKFVSFQLRRWLGATRNIRLQAKVQENDLPFRHAVVYVNKVRENISTGRYDFSYPPYSPYYLYWKRHVFKSQAGFWRLKGHLMRSLTAFKLSNQGWMGGVPPGMLVEGTSWYGDGYEGEPRYIAEYANWMEYGRGSTKNAGPQPARPLFEPTLNDYYRNEALRQGMVSLNKIASKWD